MSKVSRSVYQKKSEECKSLMADMKSIVMCDKTLSDEAKQVFTKWRKHFQKEQDFNSLMKECATEYISKHPDQFKFLNGATVKSREVCLHANCTEPMYKFPACRKHFDELPKARE